MDLLLGRSGHRGASAALWRCPSARIALASLSNYAGSGSFPPPLADPATEGFFLRLNWRAEDAALTGTSTHTRSQRMGTTDLGQPAWSQEPLVYVWSCQSLARPLSSAIWRWMGGMLAGSRCALSHCR